MRVCAAAVASGKVSGYPGCATLHRRAFLRPLGLSPPTGALSFSYLIDMTYCHYLYIRLSRMPGRAYDPTR